jgi:hypothetical protein
MPFLRIQTEDQPIPVLAQVEAKTFELCNGFRYRPQRQQKIYTVPKDPRVRTYDLASIPGPLTWLIPTYGQHTLAAVLHDDLIDDDTPTDERAVVDRLFRDALGELDVPWVRRWLLWGGTAVGTVWAAGRWSRARTVLWAILVLVAATAFWASVLDIGLPWPGDAGLIAPLLAMTAAVLLLLPRHVNVGLITIPTALYLLIPAVVIIVALGVYGLVEWMIKWLLKAVNRVRPGTALRVPRVLIRTPPPDRSLQCKDALADAADAGP